MKTTRTYTMTTRAAAAEETRQRILQSTFELQSQRLSSEIGLGAIADLAGVSVQTVLRHFGTREALMGAAISYAHDQIREERRTPVGDVAAAIRVIVGHYEKRGDLALLMLAQESTHPHLTRMAEEGKGLHRIWVTEVFAPWLASPDPDELVDLLVVATDVYTWKLLRRDRGMSRARTEQRIETLVTAILPAAVTRKES